MKSIKLYGYATSLYVRKERVCLMSESLLFTREDAIAIISINDAP